MFYLANKASLVLDVKRYGDSHLLQDSRYMFVPPRGVPEPKLGAIFNLGPLAYRYVRW